MHEHIIACGLGVADGRKTWRALSNSGCCCSRCGLWSGDAAGSRQVNGSVQIVNREWR